ncbi:MAG: hypothetical protein DRR19_19330 [Candidatus Parabeggiatoa sp. nov. 1]|nr:MAG: hypothetical protein DRR19_19330 [Gammaproteobacteria bacterium]
MCGSLYSQVHEWLDKKPEFKITDPEQFDLLRNDIKAVGNEDEIALTIAMCALGPKAGEPPEEMRPHLYELLTNKIPDNKERIRRAVEFAIAYGCGWQRGNTRHKKGWEGIWHGALDAMEGLLSLFILQACKALAYQGPGPGGVRYFPRHPVDEEIQDVQLIAMQLIRGKYQEGQPKYKRYHALSEWEPREGNLYGFLQWAIQGSVAKPQIHDYIRIPRVGYFGQGMYYPVLEENGLLLKGDMEFKKCQEILPNGKTCETEFEGNKCRREECQKPFNHKISRMIKKRMLYVPSVYQYKSRQRCNACGNYFVGKLCPLCGGNKTQGTTYLLVYEPIATQNELQNIEGFNEDETFLDDLDDLEIEGYGDVACLDNPTDLEGEDDID